MTIGAQAVLEAAARSQAEKVELHCGSKIISQLFGEVVACARVNDDPLLRLALSRRYIEEDIVAIHALPAVGRGHGEAAAGWILSKAVVAERRFAGEAISIGYFGESAAQREQELYEVSWVGTSVKAGRTLRKISENMLYGGRLGL